MKNSSKIKTTQFFFLSIVSLFKRDVNFFFYFSNLSKRKKSETFFICFFLFFFCFIFFFCFFNKSIRLIYVRNKYFTVSKMIYYLFCFYFLCKAFVSSLGSGFVCNPDSNRFNSAMARPGFNPWMENEYKKKSFYEKNL